MKNIAISMAFILFATSSQAQPRADDKFDPSMMEMKALTYRKCIEENFGTIRKIIIENNKLKEEVLQSCIIERKNFTDSYLQLSGGPQDVIQSVTISLEDKFFVESQFRHDRLVATFMTQIAHLRGLVEFCPSVRKQETLNSLQNMQKFLPKQHAPFGNSEIYNKELTEYYTQFVLSPIAKSGVEEWCRLQKEAAQRAGVAGDYFN